MSETAERTDPALWEEVKQEVTAGSKGGRPGQWSARKAQLAVAQYKKRGGGYRGAHDPDNALHRWTKEDWGTRSGEESGKTGERYLPKAAREELTELLGRKVHLFLHVKTDERWSEDKEMFEEMGLDWVR